MREFIKLLIPLYKPDEVTPLEQAATGSITVPTFYTVLSTINSSMFFEQDKKTKTVKVLKKYLEEKYSGVLVEK